MEINTENCVITKTKRVLDGHGTLINETVVTISGKTLKECFDYYKKVRAVK